MYIYIIIFKDGVDLMDKAWLGMCHRKSRWGRLLIMSDVPYAFISLCTVPFAVSGVFYSNCVYSLFCLSGWTMISRKANTIYPQNSAHDCSLNI